MCARVPPSSMPPHALTHLRLSPTPLQKSGMASLRTDGLRGKVAIMARDQSGCRMLQTRLDACEPGLDTLVFRELLPHLSAVAMDAFGESVQGLA